MCNSDNNIYIYKFNNISYDEEEEEETFMGILKGDQTSHAASYTIICVLT